MLSYVFCKSERVLKNGVLHGRQRYLCKDCKKNFKTGVRRSKYSLETRVKIIRIYKGMCVNRNTLKLIDYEIGDVKKATYIWH